MTFTDVSEARPLREGSLNVSEPRTIVGGSLDPVAIAPGSDTGGLLTKKKGGPWPAF